PKTGDTLTFDEIFGPLPAFQKLNVVTALDLLDRALFSVELHTDFVDANTDESLQTHQNLGIDCLRRITRDSSWVDDLLNQPAPKWKDKVVDEFIGDDIRIAIGKKTMLKHEVEEATVNFFAETQGSIAHEACRVFPGVGPRSISTVVTSGGTLQPVILFYAHQGDQKSPGRPFERRQKKTLEFTICHAQDLEAATGKNLEEITDKGIQEVFTQVYTSSVSHTEPCSVVWMGHPSLYRIGYIHNRTLFVSNWRSTEPERVKALLCKHMSWKAPISQGHLVRETLALSTADMEGFISRRQNNNNGIIVNLAHLLTSPFESLARYWTSEIVLGDGTFYGSLKPGGPFPLHFPTTIKPRFVWCNSGVVAKAVGPDELKMWHHLATLNISGVPTLLGTMTIHSKPNAGRSVIFLSNCGEPVMEAGLDLDEEDGGLIRSNLRTILRTLRSHGIHHHDIHGRNVLRKGDRVYLTDFGTAVQAQDCRHEGDCPDLEFLLDHEDSIVDVPDLVPSSSQLLR
ncbi:hypothetical protein B0H13DRAFT_1982304, partial [Mycena leptocephala]